MTYSIVLTDIQDKFMTTYIKNLNDIDKSTNPNSVLLNNQDFLQKYVSGAVDGWIEGDAFRLKERAFAAFQKLTSIQQMAILTQLGINL